MYNRKLTRRNIVHLLSLVMFKVLLVLFVASCQSLDSNNRDVKLIVNYLEAGPSLRDLVIIENSIKSINNESISAAYSAALKKYPLAFHRFQGLSAEDLAEEYSPTLSLQDALSLVESGLPEAGMRITTMSASEIKQLYEYLLSTEWRMNDDTHDLSHNALAVVASIIDYINRLGYIAMITDLNVVIDLEYYKKHKEDLHSYYWMVYFLSTLQRRVSVKEGNILRPLLKEEMDGTLMVLLGLSFSIVYIKNSDHNYADTLCKDLYGIISEGNDIDYISYLVATDIFNEVDGEYVVKTMNVLPDSYFVPFVNDRTSIVSKYYSQLSEPLRSNVADALGSIIEPGEESSVDNITPDVLRELEVSFEEVMANITDPIEYLRYDLTESELIEFTKQYNEKSSRCELYRAFCRMLLNANKSGSKSGK